MIVYYIYVIVFTGTRKSSKTKREMGDVPWSILRWMQYNRQCEDFKLSSLINHTHIRIATRLNTENT